MHIADAGRSGNVVAVARANPRVAVVLMAAYAAQGDYVRQVAFMTPGAVLIGSGGSPMAIASDRVVMTLLGVLVAAGIALGLSWFDRWRAAQQTGEEMG